MSAKSRQMENTNSYANFHLRCANYVSLMHQIALVTDQQTFVRQNKLIEKFLSIIFDITDEEKIKSFSKLKNSELKEVITDFFILNPIALDLLRVLRNVADTEILNQKSSSSEPIAESTKSDS